MQTPRKSTKFYALRCIGQFGELEEKQMNYVKQMVRRLLGLPAIKSKEELQRDKFNDLMDAMKDFEDMYRKH